MKNIDTKKNLKKILLDGVKNVKRKKNQKYLRKFNFANFRHSRKLMG